MPDSTVILQNKHFRLATTSFIIPDHIAPNVEKLAPYFDEIELLVFESDPLDRLPAKTEIKRLDHLSQEYGITYNVHLPVDVSLSDENGWEKACDHLHETITLFGELPVTTHTLHLEMSKETAKAGQDEIKRWQDISRKGLSRFLATGVDPRSISIETLDYLFYHVEPLIREFGLSVCVDAGHQIKYGYDLLATFEAHKTHLPLIHLHGVDFQKDKIRDHTGLDVTPGTHLNTVFNILEQYAGTVSLEVFNLENLNRCLAMLSSRFAQVPDKVII